MSVEGEKGKEMEGREGLGMRGKWKEEIGSGKEVKGEGGADSRYQYCSHRFHRLTALIIHHALTLSFSA